MMVAKQLLLSVGFLLFFSAGCSIYQPNLAVVPQTAPTPVDASLESLVVASEDCPTTTPAAASDLVSVPSDFPASIWFHNPSHTIWAGLAPDYQGRWYAEVEHKVLWRRQEGALQIEGNRLDGPAPPLEVHIPTGYGDRGIQSSDLLFPVPGCWEVVAQAEQETLRFVIYVYPIAYAPASPPYHRYGDTLAELVQEADAVMLGEVETSRPFGKDFLRQHLRIIRSWKGDLGPDEQIVVLQDRLSSSRQKLTQNAQTLERGQQYLLILEQRPNHLWRIVNERRSVGQVAEAHVQALWESQWQLWDGESLAAVDQNLRDLLDR